MGDIDENGLPMRDGIYLAECRGDKMEIDVYEYEPKGGLCCYADDFGSSGTGVDDEHDCHVSVQNTGLVFLKRVRDLE